MPLHLRPPYTQIFAKEAPCQREGLTDSVFSSLDFLIPLSTFDAVSLELLLPLDFFLGQLRCGKLKLSDKAKVNFHLLHSIAVDALRGVDNDYLNKFVDQPMVFVLRVFLIAVDGAVGVASLLGIAFEVFFLERNLPIPIVGIKTSIDIFCKSLWH